VVALPQKSLSSDQDTNVPEARHVYRNRTAFALFATSEMLSILLVAKIMTQSLKYKHFADLRR
jgi:hypothetical protein